MSQIEVRKDGSLSLILENQTEFTQEELALIAPLQQRTAQLSAAKASLKESIGIQKLKLMESPDYIRLKKLEEKLSTANKLEKENTIILSNEYKKVFKRNNAGDISDIYCDILPDTPVKAGKRGRPRLGSGDGL
jgi:hypothetical protein